MSIINQALKKTQLALEEKQNGHQQDPATNIILQATKKTETTASTQPNTNEKKEKSINPASPTDIISSAQKKKQHLNHHKNIGDDVENKTTISIAQKTKANHPTQQKSQTMTTDSQQKPKAQTSQKPPAHSIAKQTSTQTAPQPDDNDNAIKNTTKEIPHTSTVTMAIKLPSSIKYAALTLLIFTTLYLVKLFFITTTPNLPTISHQKTKTLLAATHPLKAKPQAAATPEKDTAIDSAISLSLNGTFISKNQRTAVIDNQILHEGDTIDGYVIDAINNKGVKVRNKKTGSKAILIVGNV